MNVFIHDSLHTGKNVLFEMEQVASVMPSGAAMVVDDIGSHDGFVTFARSTPDSRLWPARQRTASACSG